LSLSCVSHFLNDSIWSLLTLRLIDRNRINSSFESRKSFSSDATLESYHSKPLQHGKYYILIAVSFFLMYGHIFSRSWPSLGHGILIPKDGHGRGVGFL